MANITRRQNQERELSPSRSAPAWDPFQLVRAMMGWDPFGALDPAPLPRLASYVPAFDITETKDAYLLEADLPGTKEEDLEISLVGRQLSVSGVRQEERREESERRHLYERSYGAFTRSFSLPDGVEPDQVSADLKDGVLRIRLPKAVEAQARRIPIGEPGGAKGGGAEASGNGGAPKA